MKTTKIIYSALVLICLFGCSSSTSNKNTSSTKTESFIQEKNTIKISDIDWKVDSSILDGDNIVSFDYTNKSKYVIADVRLTFTIKEGTTLEQMNTLFAHRRESQELTDEEMMEIYILGENCKFADPKETVDNSPCSINGTYDFVDNMDQYNVMEPSKMEIAYIGSDNKMYGEYYDFKSKNYSMASSSGKEIQQWTKSELAKSLPMPKLPSVQIDSEGDSFLYFTGYGVTKEMYNDYLEACKKEGFQEDNNYGDSYFMGDNKEGNTLSLRYIAYEEKLSVSLSK